MNTNAKFLTSDELISALTDVLKLKSEEWTSGIAVNNGLESSELRASNCGCISYWRKDPKYLLTLTKIY